MDAHTKKLIEQAISAIKVDEEEAAVIDEEAFANAISLVVANVLNEEKVLKKVNEALGEALEKAGLAQFNTDKYLVAVDSIHLGASGGLVIEAIGPGTGRGRRMTIQVK